MNSIIYMFILIGLLCAVLILFENVDDTEDIKNSDID